MCISSSSFLNILDEGIEGLFDLLGWVNNDLYFIFNKIFIHRYVSICLARFVSCDYFPYFWKKLNKSNSSHQYNVSPNTLLIKSPYIISNNVILIYPSIKNLEIYFCRFPDFCGKKPSSTTIFPAAKSFKGFFLPQHIAFL